MTRPALPPRLRSRIALGLTARAAEGRFALPVCAGCGTAHYPPQEICPACLGEDLLWRDLAPEGEVLAGTQVHQSLEPGFNGALPLHAGLVRHGSGATLLCFLHPDCRPGMAVRLHLRIDRGGSAVPVATPPGARLEEEPALKHFSRTIRDRNVLVAGAGAQPGLACAQALQDAGAARVWLGSPDPGALPAGLPGAAVALDLNNPASVAADVAGIAPELDVLVISPPRDMACWSMTDGCISGTAALAEAVMPHLQARQGSWVSILSAAAFAMPPGQPVFAARMAALDALSRGLRARLNAAGGHVLIAYPGPLDLPDIAATPGPKLTPEKLGKAIADALSQGGEDLYPDPVSRDLRLRALAEPKALERELAQSAELQWR